MAVFLALGLELGEPPGKRPILTWMVLMTVPGSSWASSVVFSISVSRFSPVSGSRANRTGSVVSSISWEPPSSGET